MIESQGQPLDGQVQLLSFQINHGRAHLQMLDRERERLLSVRAGVIPGVPGEVELDFLSDTLAREWKADALRQTQKMDQFRLQPRLPGF